MAFDGLFTTAMVNELQVLQDGRISRIHQPNGHEVILTIRSKGKNYRLLASIHPSYSRIHFTEEAITNPPEPPMFCMVLRKHLEGGFITSVEQFETDRIITMSIRAKNEIGDDIDRKLYIEIMGRHSNIILVDPAREMIIDSLKHLPPSVNSYRTVLPGQPYIPAPPQDKNNPFATSEEQFVSLLPSIETGRDFVRTFSGFSPINGEELFHRLQGANDENPYAVFKSFLASFNTISCNPNIAEKANRTVFSATTLSHADKTIAEFNTVSELLDKVYFERAKRERVRSQAADLERWLNNEITKLKTKMVKLEKEQKSAGKLDTYQLYGELLTANGHAIQKGATEATVDNYYEQGTQITIPLDPQKSAFENAQRFFSRYTKAKNALVMIAEQLEITKDDIEYFEMVKQQVLQASPDDIAEIREELYELGYMKSRSKNTRKKNKRPMPETYHSSTGTKISVGKNNKQNDYLTFKMAARNHIWLHTKDIPGSHVVIHSDSPDETTLTEAAILAAYFSKARESSSVPVDYTEVKQVKKPNGAKPGFVIYFEQKTLFVTPEEDLVRKLFG
ncbi:NFACT family protein [Sporosarcina pasteurii]|uniref:Rqc2 homolog RqcH n=1 Tax=Sporosarcina pasteurii TaxID=1474 RepID=A0A380BFJ7_SPOPA|nr:NFACT RNA binding domain-containing protein [Sporosarcina pasteurii]MDS9470527.1 NFACT RNA binding domain-containing protein [Sporosarcina pasteurii]QBQ05778.1 fibronectin/fibrinogen-binding protein [Sporosarcina pasteurii]SUJ00596.1 Fibronectin-binding protein A N-terminus (FbpA) [Sporosarcina pasteurii]